MADDDDHYWGLIEKAFEDVSIYDGPESFARQFNPLPQHVRHLLAAHWFYSEYQNGGLHQFFYNPTGVLAPEAIEGLKAIGLTASSDCLQEAVDRVGVPYPRDREQRMSIVGNSPFNRMSFEHLDEKFEKTLGDWVDGSSDVDPVDTFGRAADAYAKKFKE